MDPETSTTQPPVEPERPSIPLPAPPVEATDQVKQDQPALPGSIAPTAVASPAAAPAVEASSTDRVERFKQWVVANRWLSALLILGVIIIAIGKFSDALDKITHLVSRPKVHHPHVVLAATSQQDGSAALELKF